MNLSTFFEHWKIVENPFRGEEARQDPVFLRLEAAGALEGSTPAPRPTPRAPVTTHSDFEKIAGDFIKPSSAIVFGEKGSGKTAIRLQLADRVAAHNAANPQSRCLLVPYDELNPVLDRFHDRTATERKPNTAEVLAKFRLVDHIDAILSLVVPRVVDALLKERQDEAPRPGVGGGSSPASAALKPPGLDLGPEPRKTIRKAEPSLRQELLLLQAVYDRPENADVRTRRLRRVLRLPMPTWPVIWTWLAFLGWLAPVGLAAWAWQHDQLKLEINPLNYAVAGLAALFLVVLAKRSIWDRLAFIRLGHRVRRQVRVIARGDGSYGRSLRQLQPAQRDPVVLPTTKSDEQRYAMVERLRRVLRFFGFAGIIVVIDRVDEPTLISGDPERMRSIIWPMLNNKFLQQDGLGVKMLLPMELRHALFRESAAFFQEARLDKQNLIERLSWTGAMLYDLCNARLQACREKSAPDQISLLDLFAEDVTRQDLVDALDHMHQPRDAFKLLYQCLAEHCSNVTHDQAQWRIPRLVLESVRKQQAERVRQLFSGVRPA